MAIKASGYLLKDMTQEDGYSIVDYPKINRYLENPDKDERLFTQKIKSFVLETSLRPSIETGFHSLLGKYVIHSHSVFANLLTCSEEGHELTHKLFPKALWIPYATPGIDITLEIRNQLKSQPSTTLFLQNHGLIVSGSEAIETYSLHEDINAAIQSYFKISEHFDAEDANLDLDFCTTHVLFPDQVVYTLSGDELLKSKAAQETLASYKYLLKTMEKLKLTPHFVSQDKAKVLMEMESEKFRQGKAK